ncbi:MAG: hypothetical protein Q9220_001501 [cf. Caloplaca sp. 1 TL-2023]
METSQVRISEIGFKIGIGVLLGIAIALAIGRTYIRIIQTRKISVDDGFFFLAVVTLIAGTTTLYIDIPYLFVQQNVDRSTTSITPQFISLLLLITIPTALLHNVRIPPLRKLLLTAILSLSIFTMIVSIVRIAGADLPNGSVDSAWVNFWLQVEAAVAVMVVSVTSFRALFTGQVGSGRGGKSPRYVGGSSGEKKNSGRKWYGGGRSGERREVEMPTMPGVMLTGVRTVIGRARGENRESELVLPLQGRGGGIMVTREADVDVESVSFLLGMQGMWETIFADLMVF